MFLLIDKPKGITSHDVVDRVRVVTGERKVGHAGTLDPMATGLLIVGVGRTSTKQLGELTLNTKKTYLAEIYLGEERDTDDIEGRVTKRVENVVPPTKIEVKAVLDSFLGEQKQKPPAYSAIKIKGKKAYELARAGIDPKLKLRSINVYNIRLEKYEFPLVKIKLEVSAGTYIRSIARGIGAKLGMGAYLYNLKRTRIGEAALQDAIKLADLGKDAAKREAAVDLTKTT